MRRGYGAVSLVVAVLALAGCSTGSGGGGSSTPAGQPGSPSASLPTPSSQAPSTPASSAPAPTAPATTTSPKRLSLSEGQTAHLAHFDVTLLESVTDPHGTSIGWKVKVCNTHPHPGQRSDGTTRVSPDPWRVQVRDGEGGGAMEWIAFSELPPDPSRTPALTEQKVKPGQCASGWLATKHGNPDLQFGDLRYAPSDFGDVVTWRGPSTS